MTRFFYILIVAILFSSCSEYQKALKSEDVSVKYAMAEKMYEKEKYSKAIRLFDQIAPSMRGKRQAEKLFYMYAQSYFKTKQYYSAAYQFEQFAASYPASSKVEEARFLSAKSSYMLSPSYSLDQADTYTAIDKLQNFIDAYPNSVLMAEANQLVKELREKLEKKAYEIAKQYHKTGEYFGDYKAAITAFDNFLIDYPGTPLKEDALYYKFDSSYLQAINSVPQLMEERLHAAKANYQALVKFRPDTKYKKEADERLAKIDTELQKYSK
jgi:outer membrane protein assembly factor BamD